MAQNLGNCQVVSKCRVPSELLRCAGKYFQHCGYHWGNYDANSGQCCKMRDAETTECYRQKLVCKKVTPIPNRCQSITSDAFLHNEYPNHLKRLLVMGPEKCDLYRYDTCHYEPSDKSRRYQRTWADCPYIWLRSKPTCRFDTEYYSPINRRPKPPLPPPRNRFEMFNIRMSQLCKTCRLDTKPKLKCRQQKTPKKCKKELAPMPSFSECAQSCRQRFCPTECTCSTKSTLCEMWRTFHKNDGIHKGCTEALVAYCPYKTRSRSGY